MKKLVLLILLSFFTTMGIAQVTSMIGFYGGGGLATSNNIDLSLSGGLSYDKAIFPRTALGITAMYQGYALFYDNEAYGVKNGLGRAGVTVLNRSSYIFLAPKLMQGFGKTLTTKVYVTAGAGFNMGGEETMRKWDNTQGTGGGNYDSLLTTTPNIKSMLLRFSIGVTQYIYMGNLWFFTIGGDFGFVPTNISTTSDPSDPSRTYYSPHTMRPNYFSLHLGVARGHRSKR